MSSRAAKKLSLAGRWWMRTLRYALRLRATPRALAGGVGLGLLVAFTPTVGFQMIIAAALATVLRASRPAAIIPVWITNPLTIPPIYAFTFWVGTFFYPGPATGRVFELLTDIAGHLRDMAFYDILDQFREFFRIGWEVFIPMWIGGLIVGGVIGAAGYLLTLGLMNRLHAIRLHRQTHRRRRRLRPIPVAA